MNRIAFSVFLIAAFVLPLRAAATTLTITQPTEGQAVLDEFHGMIRLKLTIETPKPVSAEMDRLLDRFSEGNLAVYVNGESRPNFWFGGGGGNTETMVFQDRDILLSPGPDSGRKTIEVRLGDFSRRVTIDYRPVTRLEPLGICGEMAIFDEAASCTFIATNIRSSRVAASVNDQVIFPNIRTPEGNDNLLVIVLPPGPHFRKGRNEVLLMATDRDGQDTDRVLVLHHFPNGAIPLGAGFLVQYGFPGSKSGPYYGCEVQGGALAITEYLEGQTYSWTADPSGNVIPEQPMFARMKAVKPGTGKILLSLTPNFLYGEDFITELPVSVFDPAETGSSENGEEFLADGEAFRCRLPFGWARDVSTSGDADKVYGVTTFAPGMEEGTAAVIKVEYFPKGNLLHATPERFMAAHLDPRFQQEGETSSAITVDSAGGRKCWTFDELEFEYYPRNALHPRVTRTAKKFYVIPETKNSFFAIRMEAPEEKWGSLRPFFDSVVESFRPRALKPARPRGKKKR